MTDLIAIEPADSGGPSRWFDPDYIIENGMHAGFEYQIRHNGLGYRCGYIRVLHGHPWHGVAWNCQPVKGIAVHGGCTLAEAMPGDSGWWIGFDCAHGCDAPDPDLPSMIQWADGLLWGDVWTTDRVRIECVGMIEQACAAVGLAVP